MAKDRKVILVTRRTRLQELVSQYNTEAQAAFVIETKGLDFQPFRDEHLVYTKALAEIDATLGNSVRVQHLERGFLPNFIFGDDDIVVTLGQDGLVANTLKYLNRQPVIAVNPEPLRYDGLLLPFTVDDIAPIVNDVVNDRRSSRTITMAEAQVNDGQKLIAVNDFFIGPKFQTSAQYELSLDERTERQSSSGVIVSTGLGSTGWMKSVFAGAQGVSGKNTKSTKMNWDAESLRFAVREPFPSQTTGTELIFGEIHTKTRFNITSQISHDGVLFSDGMIDDYIEFNSGARVDISVSERRGQLVI